MRIPNLSWVGVALLCAPISLPSLAAQRTLEPQEIPGEPVPAAAISPLVIESMDAVLEREKNAVYDDRIRGIWNGEDGRWIVPSLGMPLAARSGAIAVVNEWGDPRIGIRFGRRVDVETAALAGHGTSPADSVVVVGYRNGVEIGRTDRIELEGGTPHVVPLTLVDVDRIELVATRATSPMAFLALDDLTFRTHGSADAPTVLDFEDLDRRAVLTGSRYAGLAWESGTGLRGVDRDGTREVSAPQSPERGAKLPGLDEPTTLAMGGGGTTPSLSTDFVGPRQGDPGGGWIPPDTCGAVGPDHFLSVTNMNLSAWTKDTGQRVLNVGLTTFFNSSMAGDPRAAWDHHAQRYVVMATDFNRNKTLYFGVSVTADPAGSWFKFSFRTDQGSDAGRWPDYPTLGLDQYGIYTAAYMVGSGARMTIWAIDKANLQGPTPSTPSITAFRSLPWEGAIQPCMTYGTGDPQFFVSRYTTTALRLRRLTWSGSTPQLFQHGYVSVPSHGSPPNAPALGSNTPLSTIDWRPMNAVFRNGSVWAVQGVSDGGKAAVRWYEMDVSTNAAVQVGTITDPVWHYFYGSIAVDARGDVALGFSGSHSGSYAGAFVTGRVASDPPGETALPILVKAGEGAYERTDGSGRNRWGDYSLTSVDPVDDLGFWSIQEYARTGNSWGTWITHLGYERITYGAGLAGTAGVPELTAVDRPVLGGTMGLSIDNSTGSGVAPGVLLIGIAKDSQSVLGGTLLVQPFITADIAVPSPELVVPVGVPNDSGLIGTDFYFQAVQVDTGAPQGLSFTAGLEIRPVTR